MDIFHLQDNLGLAGSCPMDKLGVLALVLEESLGSRVKTRERSQSWVVEVPESSLRVMRSGFPKLSSPPVRLSPG
jgi:hypothetical protein